MPSFFIVFLVFWILLNLQGNEGGREVGRWDKWGDKHKVTVKIVSENADTA